MTSRLARTQRFWPWAVLALLILWILANSWVAEDAYLTFRVLDNAIYGYGLRWNLHERVQVYTHPLWLFLLMPFYVFCSNPFLVSIAVGIACMVVALILALKTAAGRPVVQIVFFLLPVMASRTLVEYATAGLESPLVFALVTALFLVSDFEKTLTARRTYYIFLLGGLAMLTRLDMSIVVGPVLVYTLLANWSRAHLKAAFLGLLPILGWLLFSFFYYGFFLPNTAYAKLGNGLPASMQLESGLTYFKLLLTYDFPASIWLYIILPIVVLLCLKQLQQEFYRRQFLFAAGALCYLIFAYVAGGDYMAGRFMAVPLFVTHLLFLSIVARTCARSQCIALALALSTVYVWYAQDRTTCQVCYEIDPGVMIDAREVFSKNQLVRSFWPLGLRSEGEHGFAREGRNLNNMPPPRIKVQNFAGMAGYYAGQDVILVDQHGLSDPLLARLPSADKNRFYAGHFYRELPQGYLYALHTGSTQQMDVMLASYYNTLKVITQAPLFDSNRLYTLIAFYRGDYDWMRDDYVKREKH